MDAKTLKALNLSSIMIIPTTDAPKKYESRNEKEMPHLQPTGGLPLRRCFTAAAFHALRRARSRPKEILR
jgi:hypothetical protein